MLREEVLSEWEQVKNKLTNLGQFKQTILIETTGQNQPLPEAEIITLVQKQRFRLLSLERATENLKKAANIISLSHNWEENFQLLQQKVQNLAPDIDDNGPTIEEVD